jgi:hypothetical protein
MPTTVQTTPDPSRDTMLEDDLPQVVVPGRAAQIGDSITVLLSGDRIKVMLLEFVDPAVVEGSEIEALITAQWDCPALTDRADDSVRLPS